MFLDDEMDIIEVTSDVILHQNILLYPGNSFCKKILRIFKNLGTFVQNNRHNSLPPDFYSNELDCMFDVMRINDSEIKKSYNPVKIRERQAEKDIKNSGLELKKDTVIFINSESNDIREHTYKNYRKNCNRVLNEHIKKIPIWGKEHPNIKYKGLLIFDETECYFDGYCKITKNNRGFFIPEIQSSNLHKPWMDIDFINNAYNSQLDFIAWVCPYKPYSLSQSQMYYEYPQIAILDTRFKRTDYIQYNSPFPFPIFFYENGV